MNKTRAKRQAYSKEIKNIKGKINLIQYIKNKNKLCVTFQGCGVIKMVGEMVGEFAANFSQS